MATMNGAKSRLDSIKLPANMSRHSDIMFAVGAVMVIMMLVIPLPSLVLDFLLIVNIIIAFFSIGLFAYSKYYSIIINITYGA